MSMGEQFKLTFPQAVPPLDALLYGAQGRASLRVLRQWREWPKSFVALTGPVRSGVTTVLKSWAKEFEGRYLVPSDWMALSPNEQAALLDQPLALDDVDQVVPSNALLTVLNLSAEHNMPIVIGGHGNAANWHFEPKDLVSRLSAATTLVLPTLDETNFPRRLRAACLRRFIDLPDETLAYVKHRLEPSYEAIETFAAALDDAMTEQQRPATVPLARSVMHALTDYQDKNDGADLD